MFGPPKMKKKPSTEGRRACSQNRRPCIGSTSRDPGLYHVTLSVRYRRVSPIASGRSDGPLSDHRAGGQPAQRELVFMPHFRTLDLRDRREFGSS